MFKHFAIFFLSMTIFSCATPTQNKTSQSGRHQWFQNVAKDSRHLTPPNNQQRSLSSIDSDEELIKKENDLNADDEETVVEELNAPNTHIVTPPEEKQYLADIIPSARYFLKDVQDDKVNFWIKYFTVSNRDRFQRFINNGQKYKSIISDIFKENGLPEDLFFVGLIESGYYLGAKSHASAVGPWQFVRGTGKQYGLVINQQIDERRSIHKATQAAAFYFKDLYNIFGSWELALSAYNAGENGIIRRIRKGNSRNYYELSQNGMLPKETTHYVPKVRAVIHIYNHLKKYNFHMPNESDSFADTKEIPIKHSYQIKSIAKQAGMTVKEFKSLNPDLIGSYIPKMNKGIQIRVPNRKFDLSSVRKARNIASSSQRSKMYNVRRGDNLYSIAKRHRTNVNTLFKLNGLNSKSKIKIGQSIQLQSTSEDIQRYRVKRGDNLYSIAKKFNINKYQLMSLNGLSNSKIYAGQNLIIRNEI